MALFSRRTKESADQQPTDTEVEVDGSDALGGDPQDQSAAVPLIEEAPDIEVPSTEGAPADASPADAPVGISMSSFGGFGAAGSQRPDAASRTVRPPAPETAPKSTETIPGLRDNVLVRDALAAVSAPPVSAEVLNVVRQMLQGHLFLRVKGDARALLAEGKPLPLAMATLGDKNYALAYSSGAALQESVRADGDTATSAMGQRVLLVFRHVLAGSYAGLIIDHASGPARVTLPRDLLEKVLEKIDENLTIKTRLAEERTDDTAARVAEALTQVPVWIAVGRTADGKPGVAEGRSVDGIRYLEVFSHPLEVAALGRGDQSAAVTSSQLAAALAGDEGLAGVVVDAAGPWIRLSRDDLAPLLALAPESSSKGSAAPDAAAE